MSSKFQMYFYQLYIDTLVCQLNLKLIKILEVENNKKCIKDHKNYQNKKFQYCGRITHTTMATGISESGTPYTVDS